MAITGTLGRTLGAGVVACLVLLGPATGVVGAQVSAVGRAPSMAAPAGDRSVPTPGIVSSLLGAACASSSNCWAVGAYGTRASNQRTELNQALHWNGRRWSLASLPEPDGVGTGATNHLNDVFCTSPADCWAVGRFGSSRTGGVSVNQALHWNGRLWSLVPTPDPGGTAIGDSNELFGIRCTSSANCWAVGNVRPNGQNGRNEILHWNGIRWSTG
jgi:hypothetical protein